MRRQAKTLWKFALRPISTKLLDEIATKEKKRNGTCSRIYVRSKRTTVNAERSLVRLKNPAFRDTRWRMFGRIRKKSLQLCFQRRKESKGKRTKVFVQVVTPSSAPELARRCPFPAVTPLTRRGLVRHIRVNSDGTTLLCVRRRNRTPAVVLLELANCTIRIRVDPHGREVAAPIVCPQVTTSLTTF